MKLKHINHVEDLIILEGVKGFEKALRVLDQCSSRFRDNARLGTKIDGSPSVVAGYDPENGKFFVGTKGAFNKTPVVCYNAQDILKNYKSNGLINKMLMALKYFEGTIPTNRVYQGDILFGMDTESDRNLMVDDEGNYVSFKPNTIEYRIYEKSNYDMYLKASRAFIGVCWHTQYTGDSIENLEVLNHDTSEIVTSPKVFAVMSDFSDEFGLATFNDMEAEMFATGLNHVDEIMDGLKSDLHYSKSTITIEEIFNGSSLITDYAMMYINQRIKKGVRYNEDECFNGFVNYIETKYLEKIYKLKSKKCKDDAELKMNSIIHSLYYGVNVSKIVKTVFGMHFYLSELKNIVINKLDTAAGLFAIKCFMDDKESGPEGYVWTDDTGHSKLVNRPRFSKSNAKNHSR
jgi:hypothetical protein